MSAVQEKLNELLDADGGISKRKVSTLLFSNFTSIYSDPLFNWRGTIVGRNTITHGLTKLALLPFISTPTPAQTYDVGHEALYTAVWGAKDIRGPLNSLISIN